MRAITDSPFQSERTISLGQNTNWRLGKRMRGGEWGVVELLSGWLIWDFGVGVFGVLGSGLFGC